MLLGGETEAKGLFYVDHVMMTMSISSSDVDVIVGGRSNRWDVKPVEIEGSQGLCAREEVQSSRGVSVGLKERPTVPREGTLMLIKGHLTARVTSLSNR